MRQCPDRYAIRAGRNLPDKEFRYLRTVIVTAAVHRGFGSRLITSPLNLPALGRRQPLYVSFRFLQGPVFLLNSRLGLCAAPGSPQDPFSRSYGVNLPSSLTRVLSSAWRLSPQPTCVGLRYGHGGAPTLAFLVPSAQCLAWRLPAALGIRASRCRLAPSTEPLQRSAHCLFGRPRVFIAPAWYRTINRFSIAFGLTPAA